MLAARADLLVYDNAPYFVEVGERHVGQECFEGGDRLLAIAWVDVDVKVARPLVYLCLAAELTAGADDALRGEALRLWLCQGG